MNLNNLKTDKQFSEDRVGGGYSLLETDVYPVEIKLAYLSESAGGAYAVNFEFETDSGNTLRQTIYITNGKAKGQTNMYVDKKTGEEKYMPGFELVNDICLLTASKNVTELDQTTKTIKLYNYEAKKEVPTDVPMFLDLIGTKVKLAVEKQVVDKQAKNDAGVYVATGETREQNEVVKAYRERDDMTANEIRAQASEASWMQQWIDANKGKVVNKAKGAVANGATAGAPKAAPATASGVRSLFS